MSGGPPAFAATADPAAYVPFAGAERVLAALEEWACDPEHPVRVLRGPEGAGKSMLLAVLAARVGRHAIPLVVSAEGLDPETLARSLLAALGAPWEGSPRVALARVLERPDAPSLLLLVDDADALAPRTEMWLFDFVRRAAGAVHALLAVRDERLADELAGAYQTGTMVSVLDAPMTREEVEAWVRAQLARAAAGPALRARFDGPVLARLHSRSGGLPGRLRDEATAIAADLLAPPPHREAPAAAAAPPALSAGGDAQPNAPAPRPADPAAGARPARAAAAPVAAGGGTLAPERSAAPTLAANASAPAPAPARGAAPALATNAARAAATMPAAAPTPSRVESAPARAPLAPDAAATPPRREPPAGEVETAARAHASRASATARVAPVASEPPPARTAPARSEAIRALRPADAEPTPANVGSSRAGPDGPTRDGLLRWLLVPAALAVAFIAGFLASQMLEALRPGPTPESVVVREVPARPVEARPAAPVATASPPAGEPRTDPFRPPAPSVTEAPAAAPVPATAPAPAELGASPDGAEPERPLAAPSDAGEPAAAVPEDAPPVATAPPPAPDAAPAAPAAPLATRAEAEAEAARSAPAEAPRQAAAPAAAPRRRAAAPAPPARPRRTAVTVEAEPGASILVNGEPVGSGVVRGLQLAPGPHRVEVRLPDGRVVDRVVEVRGTRYEVKVR